MKKLLSILMLSIVTFGYSQEFLGIKVQGKLYETVAKLKAKGFNVLATEKNIIELVGKVQGSRVNLVIVSSPKSYTVWKFIVYLPTRVSWYSLKNEYQDYVEIFSSKYGTISDHFEFFEDPYYEGDGYELQALRNEKSTYSTYWMFANTAYSVKLDKTGCVSLSYENRNNYLYHQKELAEQNYSTF